jgi:tetratricopeptide (TPR) repeat protein
MKKIPSSLSLLPIFALLWLAVPLLPSLNRPAAAQVIPTEDRKAEADRLLQQGIEQHRRREFREALRSWEAALEIYQAVEYRRGEAWALNNLGAAYRSLSDYREAIAYYEQALLLFRAIADRRGEARVLGNLGNAYSSLSDHREAIAYFEQALPLHRAIEDRNGEASALVGLGTAYRNLSDYQGAIDYYEQALSLFRAIEDHRGEADALIGLGNAYLYLSDYREAIAYYEQALPLYRAIEDRQGEAYALTNLGIAYGHLSEYRGAIDYYEQALPLHRAIEDRQGEAGTLIGLGIAYGNLSDYREAIAYYEQALPLYRAIEDRQGEAYALTNLGSAYGDLSDDREAIAYFEQALPLFQTIEDRQGEALALMNLGNAYGNLSDYRGAIAYYEQALPLFQAIEDRSGQGILLSNLGSLLTKQEQPELAIVFYKASVNLRESIRGHLRELPQELQQSYTDSVADDYRALADLLLQQNRILEAQRVLDLLKVQELDEYLQDVQRSPETENGIDFYQIEESLLALYQQILDEAEEIEQLTTPPYESLTPQQQQRLAELQDRRGDYREQFTTFLDLPEVSAAIEKIRESTEGQNLELKQVRQLQDNLQALPQKTVLLYPLILEDRLELVLVLPDAPPLRYPVPVTADELNEVLVAFGQALKSPGSTIEPIAQQLYAWLIAPMEEQLVQAEIESIIFAPDGSLRYIPIAALHDGQQYLAQRFSISHITAASLGIWRMQNSSSSAPVKLPSVVLNLVVVWKFSAWDSRFKMLAHKPRSPPSGK